MNTGIFIAIAIFAITLPAAYCTTTETNATTTSTPSSDDQDQELDKVLANAVRSHPELKEWYYRIKDRLTNHTDAKEEDVDEVRALLKEAQNSIYEFVTGPHFNETATAYIEATIVFARPVIAALPLREIRELVKIVDSDPNLAKVVHSGKDDMLTFLTTLDVNTVKSLISQGIAPGMTEMVGELIAPKVES